MAHSPFGERLKQAQEEAGLTNEQVARALDVPLRSYQNWRFGREPKTIAQRLRIASFFGKPLSWFYETNDGGREAA